MGNSVLQHLLTFVKYDFSSVAIHGWVPIEGVVRGVEVV